MVHSRYLAAGAATFGPAARQIWVKISPRMTSEPTTQPKTQIVAIYPGTFDPVTNGHLDVISRASTIFDRLVVAVARNLDKDPLFAVKERIEMLDIVTRDLVNVEIEAFDGLLVDYARAKKARVIVRGIRVVSDYEYELQMAWMNRKIEPDIETVFMMPAEAYSYLSSRLVKELARFGGLPKGLVPPLVEERLREKVDLKVG